MPPIPNIPLPPRSVRGKEMPRDPKHPPLGVPLNRNYSPSRSFRQNLEMGETWLDIRGRLRHNLQPMQADKDQSLDLNYRQLSWWTLSINHTPNSGVMCFSAVKHIAQQQSCRPLWERGRAHPKWIKGGFTFEGGCEQR